MTVINPRYSFEFFPAKTESGHANLLQAAKKLTVYKPEFFSCTYGAGGSTRERTLDTVLQLSSELGVPSAPHLSCIGSSKDELREFLWHYKALGIRHLVTLRGDLPSGMGSSFGELHYARDLVELIRDECGDYFHIEVAAYPEMHPQAQHFEADLRHFVDKVKAGANGAITQYFFNADSYFYFVERAQKLGVNIPIIPGIMPITNHSRLARFSDACGAELPRWMRKQLEAYGDDIESIQRYGEQVVSALCERLLKGGAPGLHFYTLNHAEPTIGILNNLGFNPSA